MINRRVPALVVTGGQLRFGHCHAHRIGHALPERAGGDFDTRRKSPFRMPRRLAAPLAELLDVVQRKVVASHKQQAVQQRRAVPRRQHEAISIDPARIARIVLEVPRPQRIGHRRGAKRQPRMATVRFLHHVH